MNFLTSFWDENIIWRFEDFETLSSKLNLYRPPQLNCFRGVSKKEHTLVPTMFRDNELIQKAQRTSWKTVEKEILDAFRIKYSSNQDFSCYFDCVSHAQHHGGKTRLLDFTENIYIALWFACSGNQDKDGAIYLSHTKIVTPNDTKENGYVSGNIIRQKLAGVSKQTSYSCFDDELTKANLNEICGTPKRHPLTLFTPRPYKDEFLSNRIVKQESVFLASSLPKNGDPFVPIDAIKWIIPAEKKEEYLKLLESEHGITKKSLCL